MLKTWTTAYFQIWDVNSKFIDSPALDITHFPLFEYFLDITQMKAKGRNTCFQAEDKLLGKNTT